MDSQKQILLFGLLAALLIIGSLVLYQPAPTNSLTGQQTFFLDFFRRNPTPSTDTGIATVEDQPPAQLGSKTINGGNCETNADCLSNYCALNKYGATVCQPAELSNCLARYRDPTDLDRDGVLCDFCDATPTGTSVNTNGCPEIIEPETGSLPDYATDCVTGADCQSGFCYDNPYVTNNVCLPIPPSCTYVEVSSSSSRTGQEICESSIITPAGVANYDCVTTVKQDSLWYYDSTDGSCSGNLQFNQTSENINRIAGWRPLAECNRQINLGANSDGWVTDPCRTNSGNLLAEPLAGDVLTQYKTKYVLCCHSQ